MKGRKLWVFILFKKGFVKVHKHWGQREMIVRFAKEGDIVGHRGISVGNSLLQFLPLR